ncbi:MULTISPECIES: hypothetical protein [Roseobacteraceae]|uniref:Uncharacterized protein n=1 Tax=Pseudosulfitobacter pseudonitzschiae TaxID=1402135 RepID=A0A221K0G9_9RHOB|nr:MULTISPECIES: hypothetical protein [Roseobacteraceae]ASM72502.1 hypothetical protein SULPSESMR1_01691 [Pseudosulfitobacter pseudonitzschiae]
MPAPVPPTVPPPALRSEPATFKARAEANVTFFATLVAYMDAVVTWIGTKVTEITAIAMAGDLPELTGKAGTVLQVNGAEDGLGFLDTGTTGRAVLESETDAEARSVQGLGDVALLNFADLINTDAEWEGGVVTDYAYITPAQLKLAIHTFRAADYTSQTPWNASNPISALHGLGQTPSRWRVMLECTTPSQGYSVGDRIDITSTSEGSGARGNTSYVNATSIVQVGSSIFIPPAGGGAIAGMTTANWDIIFEAWL